MTAQPEQASVEPVTFSWLITCQWATPDGFQTSTNYGSFPSSAPFSRAEALEKIRTLLIDQGVPRKSNVLFFSLEPDVLNGGA